MISIIAKMIIKEGKTKEAMASIKELMYGIANEKGTVLYTMNRDRKKPNTFIFMERYIDKAALDAHTKTPHFRVFFDKHEEFLTKRPEIVIMKEILSAK